MDTRTGTTIDRHAGEMPVEPPPPSRRQLAARRAPSIMSVTLANAAPSSLSALRGLVRSFVTHANRVDAAGDAALLMTELTANAMLHAEAPFRVFVEVTDAGILAAVHDGDAEHAPHFGQVRERGLGIIGVLSGGRWGVTWDDDGKWVWAELRS